MTRVLIAVNDFTGPWARTAGAMTRYLSDEFEFATVPYSEIVSGTCDVLVAFWWPSLPKLRANVHPKRTILYLCDYYTWRSSDADLFKLKRALRHADAVAAANDDLAEHARRWTSAPVVVCKPGVDLEMFSPSPLPVRFAVGWAGNTDVGKGVDLKGFGLIREACSRLGVPLLVADRASSPIPHASMPEFYSQISCYVCASAAEGTPNPVLEALASGRPVVSTAVGLVPELAAAGAPCMVVPRTVDALEAGIAAARASTGPEVSDAARRSVEPFAWHLRVESWRECLRAALGSPGVRRVQPTAAAGMVHVRMLSDDVGQVVDAELACALDPFAGAPAVPQVIAPVARPVHVRVASCAPRRARGPRTREVGLLLSDQPGWAHHVGHMDLESYIGAFDYEHYHISDFKRGVPFPDCSYFDFIFSPYRRWQCEALIDKAHCLGALRSSCWFAEDPNRPPGKPEFDKANEYRAFQVVTRRSFEELCEHCPNVRYIPNPVNMRRFPEVTPVREVVALWSGNASRRTRTGECVKGWKSHIVPACEAAGVPLVFCEFRERRLPPDQMPAFYLTGSVLVMASTFEGCSKTLLESMASGLAVVSTDVGQISEMRENQMREFGDTGIVLVPRETDAIADALAALTPARVREMGDMNRREVSERWSWELWAPEFEKFLRMAL